jgi:hypothetical protein
MGCFASNAFETVDILFRMRAFSHNDIASTTITTPLHDDSFRQARNKKSVLVIYTIIL